MPGAPRPKNLRKAKAVIKVIRYLDKNDRDFVQEWLDEISDEKAVASIARRFARLNDGNFGDCKPLRDGVWELRIDAGPGYRAYYAKDGLTVVLLLCGGDKRSQNRDIDRACKYWSDFKQRRRNNAL